MFLLPGRIKSTKLWIELRQQNGAQSPMFRANSSRRLLFADRF
jgi:putative SOS response-associated peptidase YedK